jgi:hypothetical protein
MATYTAAQLYGTGSVGENITSSIMFVFTNPSASSYFTLETVPNATGSYTTDTPKNASGSWNSSFPAGLITSSYVASAVVPPGTSSLYFSPSTSVTGSNYRLRGTGTYNVTSTTPLTLFASGEKGVWYDPSDITTLFQDSAGTIPVTAVGQPVGRMLDKSGNGVHAVQNVSASRPTYQVSSDGYYYLSFNGTNSSMATSAINFTGTDKLTATIGLLVDSAKTTAGTAICTGGDPNAVNGTFLIGAPSSTADHSFYLRGSSTIQARVPNQVTGDDVLTGVFDISAATRELELIPRLSGVVSTNIVWTGTNAGTGSFGNQPLYLGSLGGSSVFFQGRIYQVIVRGALSNADQIYQAEAWTDFKHD